MAIYQHEVVQIDEGIVGMFHNRLTQSGSGLIAVRRLAVSGAVYITEADRVAVESNLVAPDPFDRVKRSLVDGADPPKVLELIESDGLMDYRDAGVNKWRDLIGELGIRKPITIGFEETEVATVETMSPAGLILPTDPTEVAHEFVATPEERIALWSMTRMANQQVPGAGDVRYV